MSSHLNALAETETGVQGVAAVFNQAPLHKFKHKDEGFAIDWSPLVPGRLVSGNLWVYLTTYFSLALFFSILSSYLVIIVMKVDD